MWLKNWGSANPKFSWLLRLCWIFPALSPLLSKPYPSDSGQGRNIPRLNIFESFLCTFISSDLACVHPVARKCAGEILTSVFSSGECLVFPPTCPHAFSLRWPHVEQLLLDHSFRQSHCSLSALLSIKPTFIYLVPVSSFMHHLSCWLFFYFLLPS